MTASSCVTCATTGRIYHLNSDDVSGLRKAGVSQSIVDYMLQTPQNYATYGYPYAYPYPYPYWGGPSWGPYWGGRILVRRLSPPPLALGRADFLSFNPYCIQPISMNYQLDHKVALVTGSTAGIGFAIAEALAAEGTKVIINGRSDDRVAQAIKKIQANHPKAKLEAFAGDF